MGGTLVASGTMGRVRVRAPELTGRGWLNTAAPLSVRDLRGRFVLLDFWTFCCINCLHVLDELRPLEQRFAVSNLARLTQVGVIKTSGGLFDFLSGERSRAPAAALRAASARNDSFRRPPAE